MTTNQTTNRTATTPRPSVHAQRWWCAGCREWHETPSILAAVKAEAEKIEREREG